jgi:four helix bundle protein
MRDWKKLRAFQQAHALVLAVYRDSERWPGAQRFALTQQLQRAVLSVPSNIVEGCARGTSKEYQRFIEIAYGSACEAQYQLTVARELEFSPNVAALETDAIALCKALGAMLEALPNER